MNNTFSSIAKKKKDFFLFFVNINKKQIDDCHIEVTNQNIFSIDGYTQWANQTERKREQKGGGNRIFSTISTLIYYPFDCFARISITISNIINQL